LQVGRRHSDLLKCFDFALVHALDAVHNGLRGAWITVLAQVSNPSERGLTYRRPVICLAKNDKKMTGVQQPLFGGLIDAQLAAIVEYSTDAIIGLALDGRITSWNPAAERLYLYTAAEVLGRHISLIVPPSLRTELDRLLARTVSGELIQGFETVRTRKDGSTVEVSISKSTIRGPDGNVTGIATITRNISAIKHSERDRMRFALEHAARAEAEMAAGRASVLARVSRVLVEDFMDHRPMLERVARIAAAATHTACVIELLPEDGGPAWSHAR
jgi:PAS domain S-box-containing protein